jgi:hypothetical protein
MKTLSKVEASGPELVGGAGGERSGQDEVAATVVKQYSLPLIDEHAN